MIQLSEVLDGALDITTANRRKGGGRDGGGGGGGRRRGRKRWKRRTQKLRLRRLNILCSHVQEFLLYSQIGRMDIRQPVSHSVQVRVLCQSKGVLPHTQVDDNDLQLAPR